jgi:hypothetical protein
VISGKTSPADRDDGGCNFNLNPKTDSDKVPDLEPDDK